MQPENYEGKSLRPQHTIRGDLDERVANVNHGKHKDPFLVVGDSLFVRNKGTKLEYPRILFY